MARFRLGMGVLALVLGGCGRPAAAPPESARETPSASPTPSELPTAPNPPLARGPCGSAGSVAPLELPALETNLEPSRANLSTWVHTLAGAELRGREAGTDDSRRAARLIATYLESLGVAPFKTGDYCQSFKTPEFEDQNVVAHLPPKDSDSSCPWLVLGAHYDALGVDEQGRVFPGADDNATGVAVMLEVARLWATGALKSELGLVLALFGAEEKDLAGSAAYVTRPSVPLTGVRMMVNVDMAGRKPRGHAVIGYEAFGRERPGSVAAVRRAAKDAKVNAVAMLLGDRSDSASFAPHVPSVFLCTTVHADYHQPTDTPDRVDYEQVQRTLRLVTKLIEGQKCAQ